MGTRTGAFLTCAGHELFEHRFIVFVRVEYYLASCGVANIYSSTSVMVWCVLQLDKAA